MDFEMFFRSDPFHSGALRRPLSLKALFNRMRLIAKWIIVALAFLALPQIVPGIAISAFSTALIVAFFWGLANIVIKPIILLVFLPINLLTLGLFTFVVNTILFWGIASFVKGFYVAGFIPAFWGALAMSAVGMFAHFLLKERND